MQGNCNKAIPAEALLEGVTKKAKHKIKEKEKIDKKGEKQSSENPSGGIEGETA